MRIGGLQKFSLIDYPGKLACVIFTQGCNFRCPYCYNSQLVLPKCFGPVIPEEEVFLFLEGRRRYLDGVVVSGGEPTLQADLIPFLDNIRRLGYAVKLDTNGSRPGVLRELIRRGLVDDVAMDVKAPLAQYPQATGVDVPAGCIQESIDALRHSGIRYEFRTTLVKSLCREEDLPDIVQWIGSGCRYTIQGFVRDRNILDPALLGQEHYSPREIEQIKMKWEKAGR
jgi:pyruvate formate lyase activating enzyme